MEHGGRAQEALDQAARTGVLPYTPEATSAREDAFDRAIVRSEMAALVDRMKTMRGHGLAPSDPLGPIGRRSPIPPTLKMAVHWGRSTVLCASLLPDGSGWSVYRCDPGSSVEPRHVGLVGMPWCEYCRDTPPSECCGACEPYRGSTEPPSPTDSASADPWRWPIGTTWTWTHAQMEDHQLALRRAAAHSFWCVSTRRTVRALGDGVDVHFARYKGDDPDAEHYQLHSLSDVWASHIVNALVCHNPYAYSTKMAADGAVEPIDAHACVVRLAEARAAAKRLAFAVEAHRHDMDHGRDQHDPGVRCAWSLLCGWIAAVEGLLRNETFYLGHVAPYEAQLLEAASGGLVSGKVPLARAPA
ncbi:hypothetical protein pkur_cds_569 [Pandoravirus kuranda]|uniref:Uncharacterized protein n=1 Tax=Pandoravirus kuranda TaxID=3019033 RepID=A0AA95J4I4_9VIRU|nr:hypothetical protein pkur_cds_569 [Pandoravirus kuranda]